MGMVRVHAQQLSSLAPFLRGYDWNPSLLVSAVRSRLAFVHKVGITKPLNASQDDNLLAQESAKPS